MQLHSIDLVQVMHPSFPARNQISPSSPFLNAFIRHYTSHPTLSISLILCPYGSGRKQCEMSPRTSRPEHSSYAIQVKTYIKFRTRAQHPAHPDSANRSQVIVCVTPRPSRSCKPPKSLQALHRHCMPFHRTPQIQRDLAQTVIFSVIETTKTQLLLTCAGARGLLPLSVKAHCRSSYLTETTMKPCICSPKTSDDQSRKTGRNGFQLLGEVRRLYAVSRTALPS
jgi:hypothetical protein